MPTVTLSRAQIDELAAALAQNRAPYYSPVSITTDAPERTTVIVARTACEHLTITTDGRVI